MAGAGRPAAWSHQPQPRPPSASSPTSAEAHHRPYSPSPSTPYTPPRLYVPYTAAPYTSAHTHAANPSHNINTDDVNHKHGGGGGGAGGDYHRMVTPGGGGSFTQQQTFRGTPGSAYQLPGYGGSGGASGGQGEMSVKAKMAALRAGAYTRSLLSST